MAKKDIKNDSVKARLREFRSYTGVSGREFERRTGMAKGTLCNQSEPTSTVIANVIREYPAISAEWLLNGEGEMLKEKRNMVPVSEAVASEPISLFSGTGVFARNVDNLRQMMTKNFDEIVSTLNEQLLIKDRTINALSECINNMQKELETMKSNKNN